MYENGLFPESVILYFQNVMLKPEVHIVEGC